VSWNFTAEDDKGDSHVVEVSVWDMAGQGNYFVFNFHFYLF
jgi:hypothetical protein